LDATSCRRQESNWPRPLSLGELAGGEVGTVLHDVRAVRTDRLLGAVETSAAAPLRT
jgi:hypothetical protein